VAFDIDADGILHVSAKDLGTGKEQKIRITASSGLSENEVDRMVKEAKEHETEDRDKSELIEAKNRADSLIYSVEKNLREFGDQLNDAEKGDIQQKIRDLKDVLTTSNRAEIEKRIESLQNASYSLSEKLYQQTSAGGQTQPPGPERTTTTSSDAEKEEKKDTGSDAVDADYEVIDDEDK
jgi:molecular chaperone DnaK